jgi:filamentous hemagglutinin family protein
VGKLKVGLVSVTLVCSAFAFTHNSAIAQIIPDQSLGGESSQVIPQNPQIQRIDGGAIRDTNLFHSFQEFNIGAGKSAYFTNPVGIENIISRVTGSNPSQLMGTLGVLGNANLFFINPNGIIFGANAKLDINGSFLASTASSITFADGMLFSAIAPQLSLLSVKVPTGLQFNNQPGNIRLEAARLQVQPDKTLALVGGDISLSGGNIIAPGGRVELGGLREAGTVQLNRDNSLSFPASGERGDVSLGNSSGINVRAADGGDIMVHARNFNLVENSKLRAGIATGKGSPDSQAGNIDINATGNFLISDTGTFISNAILIDAVGKGGDVNITSASLQAENGAQIFAGIYGEGNVGNININIRDTASFDGVGTNGINTGAYNSIELQGKGRGGNLNLNARSLAVTNGAVLSASTFGRGDAGNVNITVGDTALFDEEVPDFDGLFTYTFSSGVYSRVEPLAVGNAGNVNLTAPTVKFTNGAIISNSTDGIGNAGNVVINAKNLLFDNLGRFNDLPGFGFTQSSGAFSSVKDNGQGLGGNIIINTDSLSLTNGAMINTSTQGNGDAGKILINSPNVNVSGFGADGFSSGIYNEAYLGGNGSGGEITINSTNLQLRDGGVISALTANPNRGGNIFVNTQNLEATNGGQIITATRGRGNAGKITLNSQKIIFAGSDVTQSDRAIRLKPIESVTNQGAESGIFASTDVKSAGNGGSIFVNTNELILQDRANISGSSLGTGIAADIEVVAKSIRLQNQGAITAETRSSDGGNIRMQIRDLLLMRDRSLISTTAGTGQAPGNGGNIKIDARNGFIVAVENENNDIIANAFSGKGGVVEINAQRLFGIEPRQQLTNQSDITAFSQIDPSLNGAITINILNIDPTQGLMNLPSEPRNVEISQGCQVKPNNSEQVRFVNVGRGGVPSRPEEPQNVEMFVAGWIDLDGKVGDRGIGNFARDRDIVDISNDLAKQKLSFRHFTCQR